MALHRIQLTWYGHSIHLSFSLTELALFIAVNQGRHILVVLGHLVRLRREKEGISILSWLELRAGDLVHLEIRGRVIILVSVTNEEHLTLGRQSWSVLGIALSTELSVEVSCLGRQGSGRCGARVALHYLTHQLILLIEVHVADEGRHLRNNLFLFCLPLKISLGLGS